MTPDDPRHGSTAGHNAGCRLECCRAAKLRYDKRRRWEARQGHARLVDNTGTRRRIQALAAIGHSVPDIATRAGVSHRTLNGLDRTTRITPAIARAVAETYEALCMTPATHRYALRNRRIAARKGWPPPLAWDDIDTDTEPQGMPMCTVAECDGTSTRRGMCEKHYRRFMRSGSPAGTGKTGRPRGDSATYNAVHLRLKRERGKAAEHVCECGKPAKAWAYDHTDPDAFTDPQGRPYSLDPDRYQALCVPCHTRRDRLAKRARVDDDMVVERILAGDWRLKANRDQRLAVIERWTAGGQSQNALERLTGWNVVRDLRTARARNGEAA